MLQLSCFIPELAGHKNQYQYDLGILDYSLYALHLNFKLYKPILNNFDSQKSF
jgi:hypothetical protein